MGRRLAGNQNRPVTRLARGAPEIRHGFFADLPVNFDRILTEWVNKLTES
jgi:hypothetical protein